MPLPCGALQLHLDSAALNDCRPDCCPVSCHGFSSTAQPCTTQNQNIDNCTTQIQFDGATLYDCGTKYYPSDYKTNPRCHAIPTSGIQDKLSTPVRSCSVFPFSVSPMLGILHTRW